MTQPPAPQPLVTQPPAGPADLADLSSLDAGTICGALGRLIVPRHARWAIIWLRRVDRAGRNRLQRRDIPGGPRRRAGGSAGLAGRLGIGQVIGSGAAQRRDVPPGDGVPGGPAISLPLRDKRGVVGVVTLGVPGSATLDTATLDTLQDLADRAGVALANASRFRLEHSINQELQRLLAPRPLPSVRGVDLAAQLVAGGPGITVGGDWYDACQRPDGRVALTIGDVMGHGLRPAVQMTQLRTGVRNLALAGRCPADVLAGADEFLRRTGTARFVTCLHAVYRPEDGQLDIANAGHPRPAYLAGDGHPRPVPLGSGLPLGGAADLPRAPGRVAVATCRMVLHPGESVVMFTDGLVESRSRSTDEGSAMLLDLSRACFRQRTTARTNTRIGAAGPAGGPGAHELCQAALAGMRGAGGGDDDAAILVLRRRWSR